eukprot:CAMPEP_0176264234 /NCGR_PEP_ID=MMETSP0121_2-20121125/41527_1 /TAXON_ID=160619 /ORGANISM="Kryptoperidinium foliaceum, Strain CCMP 1326" /LENGTH=52 /DNA_ID=CAMNT_0017604237 /DNA_START=64 /DNA_END=219 /DNA_ORIENTATION=+
MPLRLAPIVHRTDIALCATRCVAQCAARLTWTAPMQMGNAPSYAPPGFRKDY